MDTSGFYKIDPANQIICGPNYVLGPYESYTLLREEKDSYSYPVDGWYWFDSEQEAYEFFNIEWFPEVHTIGLLKPELEEYNNNYNTEIENG
jgi:hypothetical protein